jgi:multidrug efflux pump subunit AcrB
LDDLGLVTDSIAEPRTFARFDGSPVVGVSIVRAKGASDVTVAEAVAAKIEAQVRQNSGVVAEAIMAGEEKDKDDDGEEAAEA